MLNHFKAYLTDKAYFTDAELNKIAASVKIVHLAKGENLYNEGIYWPYDGIVCRGLLYKHTEMKGNEKVTGFSSENYWVGDRASWLAERPLPHTSTALEDTCVALLPQDEFDNLRINIPALNQLFENLVEKNLELNHKRVTESLLLSDEERYAKFMVLRPGLANRLPLKLIASYLDMSTENLNTILNGIPWPQKIKTT